MNKLLVSMMFAAFATSALAADPTPTATPTTKQTAQQEKMAGCNKQAEGKKGDARKAFMKECLSNKKVLSPAQQAQRDKMKSCNTDAQSMKGEERKRFMKTCLSK